MSRGLAVLLLLVATALAAVGCDTRGGAAPPTERRDAGQGPDGAATDVPPGDAGADVAGAPDGGPDAPADAADAGGAGDAPDAARPDAAGDGGDAGADVPVQCRGDGDCAWLLPTEPPCRVARCVPETGRCAVERVADGVACDDRDRCTEDTVCGAGECGGGTVVVCDDGDGCTADACSAAAGCVSMPIADCCHEDGDCDDANPCTSDRCPAPGTFCKHLWIEGCCATAADCDDGDPCTADACTPAGCAWTATCCEADAECDDGRDCTADRCLEGTCVAVADALSGCCEPVVLETGFETGGPEGFAFSGGSGAVGWHVVPDAPGGDGPALYYGDPARRTYDTGGASEGAALSPLFILPGRAAAALRFRVRMNTEVYFEKLSVDLVAPGGSARLYTNSDGLHTWQDVVLDVSGAAGLPVRFAFVFSADSSVFDEGVYIDDLRVESSCALNACGTGADCDDGNGCTSESCDADQVCAYEWLVGCCVANADCDDANPCTQDLCSANRCWHPPTGDPSCCAGDADCADEDPCTATACVEFRCAVDYDHASCPVRVPYRQGFDGARTFGSFGWEAVDLVAGGPTNWYVESPEHPFSSPFARFSYDPVAVDYEHCLRSPPLVLGTARSLAVSFVHRFSAFVGSDAGNRIDVRWSTDRWQSEDVLWTWWETEGDVDHQVQALHLDVSPLALDVSLAFCVSGQDSFEINFWDVDDVAVLAGAPPQWLSVPETVTAPADATTSVAVAAFDPDGDPLTFALGAGAPAWAAIEATDAVTARLSLSPGPADEGQHTLTLLVDDGGAPVPATLQVTVALTGEVVLFEEAFTTGTFAELGWETGSDPGSLANDWQLLIGDPFASRHARFLNLPAVTAFSDTLASPPIAVAGLSGVRVRWDSELRALGDGVADPPVSVALQVSVDGGLWQTVWTHPETAGDLAPGPRSVALAPYLADAGTLRVRFRVRGGRSTAIDRWAIDDVVVFGVE